MPPRSGPLFDVSEGVLCSHPPSGAAGYVPPAPRRWDGEEDIIRNTVPPASMGWVAKRKSTKKDLDEML